MGVNTLDIQLAFEKLREKRPIFHSEADFQFALAWEIQQLFPYADIRLEYPSVEEPKKYIDIIVTHEGQVYPIELKYKTKRLSTSIGDEQFSLKDHGAQDLGAYDSVKDICRIESFSNHLAGYKKGYVVWLTNDPFYWRLPSRPDVGYAEFSVHNGVKKCGLMRWGNNLGAGTIRGRECDLFLRGEYEIFWNEYSNLGRNYGLFKYAFIAVERRMDG